MPFKNFLEIFLSTAAKKKFQMPIKIFLCTFQHSKGGIQYLVKLHSRQAADKLERELIFSRLKIIPNFSA